jgi:hypothetical protein
VYSAQFASNQEVEAVLFFRLADHHLALFKDEEPAESGQGAPLFFVEPREEFASG